MKKCIYLNTHFCPFDESDQGPPFAGSVSSCSFLRDHIYCPYRSQMKHAPEIYARNISAMHGGSNRNPKPESGITFLINTFIFHKGKNRG